MRHNWFLIITNNINYFSLLSSCLHFVHGAEAAKVNTEIFFDGIEPE
jgi:hypothetical protein